MLQGPIIYINHVSRYSVRIKLTLIKKKLKKIQTDVQYIGKGTWYRNIPEGRPGVNWDHCHVWSPNKTRTKKSKLKYNFCFNMKENLSDIQKLCSLTKEINISFSLKSASFITMAPYDISGVTETFKEKCCYKPYLNKSYLSISVFACLFFFSCFANPVHSNFPYFVWWHI